MALTARAIIYNADCNFQLFKNSPTVQPNILVLIYPPTAGVSCMSFKLCVLIQSLNTNYSGLLKKPLRIWIRVPGSNWSASL